MQIKNAEKQADFVLSAVWQYYLCLLLCSVQHDH